MSTTPPRTPNEHGLQLDYEHEHEQMEVESTLLAQSTTQPPSQIHTPMSSSGVPLTRTVAIIKPHALVHRFDIERRIQEASFEIVKERQMEFDVETDPDTLYELFGEDADAFAEGPVWVYVLERRRAVEVWNTLMGSRDVEVARHESPNSLRALYGISTQQNGLMGSPDVHTAEIQIASLFVSSPPFPTSELPSEDSKFDSTAGVDQSVLDSIRNSLKIDDEGYAPSSATNPSTSTHDKPHIVPRMSRAAALRIGQPVEKVLATPRAPVSKERLAETFANVPGHKRLSTIQVASTAAPAIAPRMTRASSLRLGQSVAPLPVKQRSVSEGTEKKNTFEGVPGHKRRESIVVASSKAPTVAPRLNKSAPSSFRAGAIPKAATLSRASSSTSVGSSRPSATSVVRPASQASSATPSRYAVPRASSVASVRPKAAVGSTTDAGDGTSAPAAPAKLRPRPSSIGAPTIAPRTNRSAALRAAKMEAENAANAAAAAARKAPRQSKVAAPPSSFKPIPA